MISLNSIMFNGMDATKIDVQVQLVRGLPKQIFNIIGLADRAVKESAERITNAMSALNMSLPAQKLTVNLSPRDVEKTGSHFDLAILLGILCEDFFFVAQRAQCGRTQRHFRQHFPACRHVGHGYGFRR